MKKPLLLIALIVAFTTAGIADIHTPPQSRYTRTAKLWRGISNLLYGSTEIPERWSRSVRTKGSTAAASDGLLDGGYRTILRLGYGVYEIITWWSPTHSNSYRPPYVSDHYDTFDGFSEYPPQLGFIGEADYSRGDTTF